MMALPPLFGRGMKPRPVTKGHTPLEPPASVSRVKTRGDARRSSFSRFGGASCPDMIIGKFFWGH